MSKIFIGIDPGVKTGLAVMVDSQLKHCSTSSFWSVMDYINTQNHEDLVVYIEKPDTKAVWHTGATSQAAKNRTAVNVGSIIREAELIIARLQALGIETHIIKPKGKVDKNKFEKITGWTKKTSQHARDAAMLLF